MSAIYYFYACMKERKYFFTKSGTCQNINRVCLFHLYFELVNSNWLGVLILLCVLGGQHGVLCI